MFFISVKRFFDGRAFFFFWMDIHFIIRRNAYFGFGKSLSNVVFLYHINDIFNHGNL